MSGPPPGFNPSQSLLPDVPATITPAMGGGGMIGGAQTEFLKQLITKIKAGDVTKISYKNKDGKVIPVTAPSRPPTKAATAPSRPPMKAAPAKPLTFDPTFFEHQESGLSCGRHALNNLLGNQYFVKDKGPDITDDTYKTLDPPISLTKFCNFLASKDTSVDPTGKKTFICLPNENYDAPVLIAALNAIGYRVGEINMKDVITTAGYAYAETEMDTVWGYIINLGDLADVDQKQVNHWVALRKKSPNTFLFMDSMSSTKPSTYFTTLNEFLTSKNTKNTKAGRPGWRAIIKVYNHDSFIDPLELIKARVTGDPKSVANAKRLGEAKARGFQAVRALAISKEDSALQNKLEEAINNANTDTVIDTLIKLLDTITDQESTSIKAITEKGDALITRIISVLDA